MLRKSIIMGAATLAVLAGTVSAKISVTGTVAEKKKINDAIARIKAGSAEGKKCFDALEAHASTVTISFGQSSDVATANGTTLEVKMFEDAINCFKKIDNPAGTGKALEASSLDLILVHEALGHLLSKLKGGKWGEPEAMAKTNKVRTDLGLPTRTKYVEKVGNKITIPYSDGSSADVTEALKKKKKANAGAGPGAKDFANIELQSSIPVQAVFNLTANRWDVFPDPQFPLSSIFLDLTPIGGGFQEVPLTNFQMSFDDSGQVDFPVEILELSLGFDPFIFLGDITGPNQFVLLNEKRGGAGFLQAPPLTPDLILDASGDYLWQNPLWTAEGFNGWVAGNIFAGMLPTPDPNVFIGEVFIDFVGFVPVPVACIADLTTTNANPDEPGYGVSDGAVNGADLSYFVEQWLNNNLAVADTTTTNTNPGDPNYGIPDGAINGADLSFFVEAWLNGCP